jgi:hypothetical protein
MILTLYYGEDVVENEPSITYSFSKLLNKLSCGEVRLQGFWSESEERPYIICFPVSANVCRNITFVPSPKWLQKYTLQHTC